MLGSAYFRRMLNIWGGNVPLAVASYNAGSGNVRKWVNAYGDPRGQVDVLNGSRRSRYSETKAYVQRVIENSVVYDSMRGPAAADRDACLALSWEKPPRLIVSRDGRFTATLHHARRLCADSRGI